MIRRSPPKTEDPAVRRARYLFYWIGGAFTAALVILDQLWLSGPDGILRLLGVGAATMLAIGRFATDAFILRCANFLQRRD